MNTEDISLDRWYWIGAAIALVSGALSLFGFVLSSRVSFVLATAVWAIVLCKQAFEFFSSVQSHWITAVLLASLTMLIGPVISASAAQIVNELTGYSSDSFGNSQTFATALLIPKYVFVVGSGVICVYAIYMLFIAGLAMLLDMVRGFPLGDRLIKVDRSKYIWHCFVRLFACVAVLAVLSYVSAQLSRPYDSFVKLATTEFLYEGEAKAFSRCAFTEPGRILTVSDSEIIVVNRQKTPGSDGSTIVFTPRPCVPRLSISD